MQRSQRQIHNHDSDYAVDARTSVFRMTRENRQTTKNPPLMEGTL